MPRPEEPKNNASASTQAPTDPLSDAASADLTPENGAQTVTSVATDKAPEYGGQKGPEPTRYGDWEKNGRCTDF